MGPVKIQNVDFASEVASEALDAPRPRQPIPPTLGEGLPPPSVRAAQPVPDRPCPSKLEGPPPGPRSWDYWLGDVRESDESWKLNLLRSVATLFKYVSV